jgi:phosphodiesterase/alkaline phosphatase D-like protein
MTEQQAPTGSAVLDRPPGDRPLSEPTAEQRRQMLVAGAALLGATITTVLAWLSNPPADEWVYQQVRSWTWVDALSGIEVVTSTAALVALAVVVLAVPRCRAFVVVGAGTLLVGAGVGWALSVLVGRESPVDAPVEVAGTYPSLGILVLTVLAGLAPPAAESVTARSWVRHVTAVLLGGLVLAAGLWQVGTGTCWPLDVVGAVLIGTALVSGARVVLEEPGRHGRCRSCIWHRRSVTAREAGPVVISVDPQRTRQLHRATLLWTGGLVAAFGVLALTRGLPRSPESGVMGSGLEVPLQWGVLALVVVGVLLARRWHLAGAIVVAFGAALLGYASSVQYSPWVALAITVALWVPALLLWLEWHRRATLRTALVAAVAASVVLGAVVGAAALTYSHYWGPTHPRSATVALDADPVEWMWSGAVTTTSADIRLRTADPVEVVRVVVSEDPDLAEPVAVVETAPDADRVAAVTAEGLQPGTRYYYVAEVDGASGLDRVQTLRTFPEGPASFTFALGSCQFGGSNGQVFDAMRSLDPLFMLSTGDWTYGNISVNEPERFRDQYDLNLTAPAQAALYAQAPFAYVWGDHDYGGNDADRTSPSRDAAMAVYRQMVPHYPLAGPETPVYQAFTVGRVRFLLTDTRAARDPAGDPSGDYRSTLGAEQREWFLGELADADRYGLVVWVNPDPWVSPASPGSDSWGGFAEERQVIADAIADQGIDNLLMVSGDAHMLAFDDGTNTDFSTSQAAGFPLLHAAAIDRPGSVKGGPYTGPVIPGGGQFGSVEVRDDGTAIDVSLVGWNWQGQRLFEEELSFR